ncbi:hypothetical protein [Pseudomonas aeruginosa]|uniref:hypothetical protein n=1 Tax=Pseudomonas aeruginosa TaxID=287 RepID=UPI0023581879|nr:hypothetical protein KKY75_17550 [Pseudomonas aeruginosa]
MSNELTDVRCPCGDEYPADSYDAGFIAGSGMCQNCDAALPPKDICTCPSGDGSLRHPCPEHPAVEQAGGDERDFQAEGAQEVPSPVSQEYDRHLISLLRKGEALPGHQEEAADEIERLRDWNDHLNNTVLPNILNPNFLMLMKGGERLLDLCTKDGKFVGVSLNDMKDVFDWMVTHARIAPDHAALAQPSPKCATCNDSGQIVVSGPHYQGEFQPPEYETEPCDMCAQPSPAQAEQAEAERPEVVAWRYGFSGGIVSDKACLDEWKSGGEYQSLMTVAQHERIVGALRADRDSWAKRWDEAVRYGARIEEQRDAARAKIAELEKREPVAFVQSLPVRGRQPCKPKSDRENGYTLPLYDAPVAQAQHGVPEGWMLVPVEQLLNMMSDKDHDTRIMAERQLLAVLAAAPSKEGL